MRRLVLGASGVAVALLISADRPPTRTEQPVDAGALLPRIEDLLELREYEATLNRDGLQAPNRAQGLRTYFEATGIHVLDRTAAGSPELLRLTVSGVGHGEALAAIAPGEVTHEAGRVEIRRTGLTEWYENRPEGLEQGFSVPRRPDGEGELGIELVIAAADLRLGANELFLRASTGRRLRYGDLRAEDARGRSLPAHLELAAADRVRLVVDDSAATYPIAIDPILTQSPDTLLQGNQTEPALWAWFGFSVASAGDVNGDGYGDLIVGAPGYDAGTVLEGAAFVFLGGPAGIASGGADGASAILRSNQSYARFGSSVASAGDVNGDGYADVIVGALGYDAPELDEGAAFIFLGGSLGVQNGNPSTAATVLQGNQAHTSATNVGGYFGWEVASAGDVNGDGYSDVLVGAPDYSGTSIGYVFVFLGSPSGVADGDPSSAATRLTVAAGAGAKSSFGAAVSSAGDVNGDGYDDVIVGAKFDDALAVYGRLFLFLGGPAGIADATPTAAAARIISTSAGSFGASVASAGDVNGDGYADIIVAAPSYGTGGAAFVYLGGVSGIASGTDLTASTTLSSTVAGSGFGGGGSAQAGVPGGGRVAGAGDVNGDGFSDVIVSAVDYPPYGAAFVFLGSSSGIASGTELSAAAALPSPSVHALFGSSLAGAGDLNGDGYDDVVVGAPWYTDPEPLEGAAWIYLGGPSGVKTFAAANTTLLSNQLGAQLGTSVASAGDVNGDGYSDVIVGAPFYDAGENDEGAAFIFHGGVSGITAGDPNSAATTLQSDQPGAQLGASVASAGDVNGDGYSDVIVGAPFYDDPNSDEGAAFVFLGSASGVANNVPSGAHARFESDQDGARLGASVASAGDVNGDGRGDVIVGAPFYSSGQTNEGAAFVFVAGPTGLANGSPATASATIRSNSTDAQLGSSVASAGDVNGDGYGDVVIGGPMYFDVGFHSGIALIFRGSASGIASGDATNASTWLKSTVGNAQLGASVSGAGDMNGDGYDDVIVGAPMYNGHGAAFVYAGSAAPALSIPLNSATQKIESNGALQFGASATGAGDVNGDGFGDVIIGGPTPSGQGSAWLFYGQASLIPNEFDTLAAARLNGDSPDFHFGASVASAGDVNGDGFADLIIGAPLANGPPQQGTAYLYYGGGHNGRPVLSRQRRGDGSGTSVQPWGDALHGDGFVAQITGSHPAGRGRVKAQAEACPAGVAFGAPGCVGAMSASWVGVTPAAPAPALSLSLGGLLPNKLIHWRARVFRAAATGTPSPNPARGPWRLLQAQAANADIRTSLDADGDTIADSVDNCRYRTNSGQEDAGGFGAASPPDGIGDVCQCGNVADGGRVEADDVLAYRQSLATGTPLPGAAQTRCVVFGTGTACNLVQISVIRRGLAIPALAPLTSSAVAQVCAATQP